MEFEFSMVRLFMEIIGWSTVVYLLIEKIKNYVKVERLKSIRRAVRKQKE